MKTKTRKQRRAIYQEILEIIGRERLERIHVGICVMLGNKLPHYYLNTSDEEIFVNFPEFILFNNGNKNRNSSLDFNFRAYSDELSDELRIFALQLCIEMTK